MASLEETQTVEQATPTGNGGAPDAGASAAGEIPVENPATGEIVATVPDLSPEAVVAMAQRAVRRSPAGRRTASRGAARAAARAEVADGQRRSGRLDDHLRDRQDVRGCDVRRDLLRGNAFGFWAKHAPEYLGDEKVKSGSCS